MHITLIQARKLIWHGPRLSSQQVIFPSCGREIYCWIYLSCKATEHKLQIQWDVKISQLLDVVSICYNAYSWFVHSQTSSAWVHSRVLVPLWEQGYSIIYLSSNALSIAFRLIIFKVKTSLGALSKTFVGIELHWSITLGSVTLIQVKSAWVTAIWIGDCYMR